MNTTQIDRVTQSVIRLHNSCNTGWPIGQGDIYVRPTASGFSAVSVDPARRPQQGISCRWNGQALGLASISRDVNQELDRRSSSKTRVTPEKKVQSTLIQDALRHHGAMPLLASVCPECLEIRFVVDELVLWDESTSKKRLCDILAIWRDGAQWKAVAMELKSSRAFTRLTEQVAFAAACLKYNLSTVQRLVSVCYGEPICLADSVEQWIILPALSKERPGRTDPLHRQCSAKGIRVINYVNQSDDSIQLCASAAP